MIVLSVQRQSGACWKTSTKLLQWNGCGHSFGVSAWSLVINAVSTMKTSGARNTIAARSGCCARRSRPAAPRRTAAGARRRTTRRSAAVAISGIAPRPVVDPAPRVADDEQRDGERDREQQHRQRRRVAHVEVRSPGSRGGSDRRASSLGVAELERALGRPAGVPAGDAGGDLGLVKYCSPWITPRTTANRITGLIVGSVTQRSRCSGPAPSSSADS